MCQLPLSNVGCLVGLSCDVTDADGSSPPAAADGPKNGGVGHRPARVKNEKSEGPALRKNTVCGTTESVIRRPAPANYWPTNAVTNRAEKSLNPAQTCAFPHTKSVRLAESDLACLGVFTSSRHQQLARPHRGKKALWCATEHPVFCHVPAIYLPLHDSLSISFGPRPIPSFPATTLFGLAYDVDHWEEAHAGLAEAFIMNVPTLDRVPGYNLFIGG